MTKLIALLALAGCGLYIGHGSEPDPEPTTYCDQDGLHECTGDDCRWVGPTCDGTFTCTRHLDCAAGCYCASGTCAEAGFCGSDADCTAGFTCDRDRSSCEPVGPSCGGDVVCTATAPACPDHQVPLVENGCYSGACRAIADCEGAPRCGMLAHEDDCLARSDCGGVYEGLDCEKPDGSACHAGDSGCVCASFVCASCEAKP